MVLDLFELSRIANEAIAIEPIAKLMNAMMTVQSNLSANQSSPSPIELADRAQRKLFIASIIFGVVAAIIAALFAWLVWKSNNRYQEVVKAAADARIAEAGKSAAQANESASKANERAQNLEHDNLNLRSQVATLETQAAEAKKDVAGLQKTAADAKAAQQRVETDLARQQERAAKAESQLANLEKEGANARAEQQRIQTELVRQQQKLAIQQARAAEAERALEAERLERLQLQDALAPRGIVNSLMMADLLTPFAGTRVIIEYADEDEPRKMANDLESTLSSAGWRVEATRAAFVREPNITVRAPILGHGDRFTTEPAAALLAQLAWNRVEAHLAPSGLSPENPITISVGMKVPTYLEQKRREELWRDFFFGEPTDPLLEPLREPAPFHHFTEEQQRRVVEELKKPVWKMPYQVQLRCPANDDEACELAMEIGALLHRAGIQILEDRVERDKNFPSFAPSRGIRIEKRILVVARWKGEM
jgi:hypothetical protein